MSNNSNKLSFKEKIKKWYAGSKEKFKNWFSEFKVDFKEKTQQKWRDIKKNTNITRELVKKNIKIQYRNSAIGAIWTVLNPLLNMLVMYFVFGTVLGLNNDPTYAIYLLCGNIIFNMMRAATTQSLTSLVANRGLLTKNKISYYVFPVSNNLSAVVNFFFSCIALFGVMLVIWFKGNPVFSWNFLLAFLMLPALFLFNYGLSMILATLYVFFRDIQHFYGVFLTLWTYLTPIFYTTDRFQNDTKGKILMSVINLNPMYHFVEYFRDVIYRCSVTGADLPTFGKLATLYMIGVVFFGVGTLIYNLTKRKFIFYI